MPLTTDARSSAAKVLESVMERHRPYLSRGTFIDQCRCGWVGSEFDYFAHQAGAVLTAVRDMTDRQQADLLGGDAWVEVVGHGYTVVMRNHHDPSVSV